MTYEVEFSDAAKEFLKMVNKTDAKRISKKIDALEENPRPHGVENYQDLKISIAFVLVITESSIKSKTKFCMFWS